jgi:hypothetical protein
LPSVATGCDRSAPQLLHALSSISATLPSLTRASGIEDGKVRLVSYHFGREATIEEASPEIVALIKSLSR